MPKLSVIIIAVCLLRHFDGQAQHIVVPSGSEFINFGVLSIKSTDGAVWSTDRSADPGFFSAVDTATYTGCSDAIHINGYIKKYGNRAFSFPVGDGNKLMALEISAPFLPTDAYAVAWIDGDPSSTADPSYPNAGLHPITQCSMPITKVSALGQWDWMTGENARLGSNTTGTGEGLKISVSIPDMTDFAKAEELRLVGWNGHSWIDLSNGSTAIGNTAHSILSGTMIAGITAIGIGKTGNNIPVRIADPVNTDPFAKTAGGLKVYPNPVNSSIDQVTIELNTARAISGRMLVFNSLQQLMRDQAITVREGINQWKLVVRDLPKGIYFIRLQGSDGKPLGNVLKLIKN